MQEGSVMVFGFPSWILGITFLFAWFFILMSLYANKLRTKIKESRVELSTLRQKGVEIRDELLEDEFWGEGYFQRLEDWKKRALTWNDEVYNAVKLISVADAEWYKTLDIVDNPPRITNERIQGSESTAKAYREHDFRLKRLGEMIRDLWGKE